MQQANNYHNHRGNSLPIEEAKNSDAEEEDTSTFSPKNSS